MKEYSYCQGCGKWHSKYDDDCILKKDKDDADKR
jgi:hypothetical protein